MHVSEALGVIFVIHAKNAAERWSRELPSRSLNLFPNISLFFRNETKIHPAEQQTMDFGWLLTGMLFEFFPVIHCLPECFFNEFGNVFCRHGRVGWVTGCVGG